MPREFTSELLNAIAVELKLAAIDAARSIAGAEHLAATCNSPGMSHAVATHKVHAELLGVAHSIFKELAQHPEALAFLARFGVRAERVAA